MLEFVRDVLAAWGLLCAVVMILPPKKRVDDVDDEDEYEDDEYEEYDNGRAELERQLWRAHAKEQQLAKQLKQVRKSKRTMEEQL